MFLRLKNVLDLEIVKDELLSMVKDIKIIDRAKEVLQILDDSYGVGRTSKDMGGYLYLFNDSKTYDDNIEKLMLACNMKPEMYEYSDTISNKEDVRWQEELYLVSSDDSVTVIHPIERG